MSNLSFASVALGKKCFKELIICTSKYSVYIKTNSLLLVSVIHNTQRPESTSKKMSNAICSHAVRESVAMGESLTAHIPSDRNVADSLTKLLYGQKRKNIVSEILFDIYDYD